MKQRLDHALTIRGLTPTRSQAESWIKLGRVTVDGREVTKPGYFVDESARIELSAPEQYVSRAGLKLASVANKFGVRFEGKIVLDVGSSTGGFTDYALQHGAKKVIAVDVGTDQLHPSLRGDERIELLEKTDIRDVIVANKEKGERNARIEIATQPDIVVIDVSFVSLQQILPSVAALCGPAAVILAMVKPQFEATHGQIGSSGVIKNDSVRRSILRGFEQWAKQHFVIVDKADSDIKGARGNQERFYVLKKVAK